MSDKALLHEMESTHFFIFVSFDTLDLDVSDALVNGKPAEVSLTPNEPCPCSHSKSSNVSRPLVLTWAPP